MRWQIVGAYICGVALVLVDERVGQARRGEGRRKKRKKKRKKEKDRNSKNNFVFMSASLIQKKHLICQTLSNIYKLTNKFIWKVPKVQFLCELLKACTPNCRAPEVPRACRLLNLFLLSIINNVVPTHQHCIAPSLFSFFSLWEDCRW